ncbi:SDR family NAD(P)-dependent oxidoreductase [Solimonas sp. K1W22B-7]|uniref:oxidoreductase n=1 Tax=Solimonas sp. K1W22B-7 TaxID=2303331 RepID=UPI000E330184|nr:oxidoreductase [Solimonas sp. K1W22B-7]AXQ28100.1 SDR family NAD(P)-dependent oxidoreductase [Solimonas sp. K1W22B-7]
MSTNTLEWSRAHLPDLSGHRALVTGAASGLGYETALGLASRGAELILADRNEPGGVAAMARIREAVPGARLEFRALDLSELASVRKLAAAVVADGRPLDILVNNAGILPPLARRSTADGFELKFGINVLGHFALDALLQDSLRRSAAPRVVWVSSLVHRQGKLYFDDLQLEQRYTPERAYNQAKLACLVLALEQQARASAAGWNLQVLAAHPGISRTTIGDSRQGQRAQRLSDHFADLAFRAVMRWLSQAPGQGALPILQAAAAADAQGGEFYGPDGIGEFRGLPRRVKPSAPALDPVTRQRLWSACEGLTGVKVGF